jgi:hypothetical protein
MTSPEPTPTVLTVIYRGGERRNAATPSIEGRPERRAGERRVARMVRELEANAPTWCRLARR